MGGLNNPTDTQLTTKGDIMVHNGTTVVRLPVGTDGQMLIADSAEPTGLKWADAPYVNDKSLLFDGVDEYVLVAANSTINDLGELTFSAWIFATADGDREIFSKNSSVKELRLQGTVGGGDLHLRGCVSMSGTGACSDSSNGSISLNVWHHVVMTFSDSGSKQVRLYIDGAEVTYAVQDTGTGSPVADASSALNIGRRTSATRFFTGNIDEPGIYDVPITPAEVTTLFNSGTPLDPLLLSTGTDLAAFWRFGDGDTFPTLADNSANSNIGTMTNMEAGDIVNDTPP